MKLLGCRLILKVEVLNPVRCFKGRGTETVLSRLGQQGWRNAVVCASAGNLGQALAFSGRLRRVAVTVVASSQANPVKVARMKSLGATVMLVDGEIEDALAGAALHAAQTGAFLVEDSRDVATCEGAATIGVELAALPGALDAVLVSLGAGAMASGVGFALKQLRHGTEVICVQPEQAPAMTLALQPGGPSRLAPRTPSRTGWRADTSSRRSSKISPRWWTTPFSSPKRASSRPCGCSTSTLAWSSNRQRRWESLRSLRLTADSTARPSPPSCAEAT